MDSFVANNGAGDLFMRFFEWGYRAPAALKAGTNRRLAREKRDAEARDLIHATLLPSPPTRQNKRKDDRAYLAREAKRHTGSTRNWREYASIPR